MSLELRLEEIGKSFTALKADIMLSELTDKERKERLHGLAQQEGQAKEALKEEYKELQSILECAKVYAEMLDIEWQEALLMMSHLEIKKIHWHIDQMTDSLRNT